MATEKLLQEFPPVSTASWEELIRKDLKGADYARKLIWQSEEGLAVKPYYRAEDAEGLDYCDAAPGDFPYARGARPSGDWRIREEIEGATPEEANREACAAAAAGAEEIAFRHVELQSATDVETLVANLQQIPVHFQNADEPLIRLLLESSHDGHALSLISTGWNPLKHLDFAAEVLQAAPPSFASFTINGEGFEESGATCVEEVGFTLAAGVEFFGGMQSREIDVDRAAASIGFSFSTGASFFFQIAKLRAFRLLWARVVESFGGARSSARARIHARTSRWSKTVYDPHVNILRGTTEAMSAAFGGADSITVAPFDDCYKKPDEASRRLARNTQILLKHEAMLGRVADPGAGAYLIEAMTEFLAREGWKTMQEIEAAGGFRKAEAEGLIARTLSQSLAAREEAVASRRRVFTGTNQYASLSENAWERIDAARVHEGTRATQAYEALRLRTERHAIRTGSRPRVLLAEMGDAKMRSARAGFAANFFACAGFGISTELLSNANEIAARDADLIVLCSSDAEYLALAEQVQSALNACGRETPVLIAGNPESAEQLQAMGIADFIHLRSNPIEVLARWQQRLGIKE